MDELVHHCLREISFDGDLGCDVSRLRQFIEGFYAKDDPATEYHVSQTIDDSFRSFVWSLIVQERSVTVGLVPEGSAPVVIAPQPSAVRKGGDTSGSKAKALQTRAPASLQPLTTEEARSSLEDLIAKYGSTLRIAVDHETSFAAITGSHFRSAKLSPMVYTALQLITRSRAHGLPMTTLGESTGYDQKTVHYLASQLIDLDLIYKVRTSGKSKHSCIHKYFYPNSIFYRQAQEEEKVAREQKRIEDAPPDVPQFEDDPTSTEATPGMDPLEPHAIGSTSIIRARVIKLLKGCPNGLHQYENLLLALGYRNPTKPDRRLFSSRIKELLSEGTIEKVYAPHNSKSGARVLCVRLVAEATSVPQTESVGKDADLVDETPEDVSNEFKTSQPVANVSMQHQVLRWIHESGTEGMTMNDIAIRMGNLDKRTVEQLLVRYEREPLPPHLADLSLVQMIETVKREHRHKYYTITNYRAMVDAEGLTQHAGDKSSVIDTSLAGGWSTVHGSQFYKPGSKGLKDLSQYQDNFASSTSVGASSRKVKQPKPGKHINPLGPDGRPRKGRPRKEWKDGQTGPAKPSRKRKSAENSQKHVDPREVEEDPKAHGKKRKVSEAELEDNDITKPPKKRGRPRKSAPLVEVSESTLHEKSTPDTAKADVRKGSSRKSQKTPKEMDKNHLEANLVQVVDAPNPGQHSIGEESLRSATIQVSESSYNAPNDDMVLSLSEDPPSLVPTAAPKRALTPSLPSSESSRPNKRAHIIPDLAHNEITLGTVEFEETSTSHLQEAPVNQPRGMAQNVSYMRREKELLQVLNELDGIAMVGVDLSKRHLDVLERWAAEGRPVSAPPGTFLDRRTLSTLGETMQARGVLKIVKTVVTSIGGIRRPTTLFCLPDVSADRLASYINNLSAKLNDRSGVKAPAFRTVSEKFKATTMNIPQSLDASHGRIAKPGQQSLAQMSPLEIRSELLRDPRVVSQLYGYMTGKMMRARELHLFTLHALSQGNSTYFVSVPDYIFKAEYLWSDIPLGVHCSIVSITHYSTELEDFLRTPEGQTTKLCDLPPEIRTQVLPGGTRSRTRILELLECLRRLGVVTPLQVADAADPYLTGKNIALEPASLSFTLAEGPIRSFDAAPFWQFNLIAPVFGYAKSTEGPPSRLGHLPIATIEESVAYWNAVKDAARNKDFTLPDQAEVPSADINADIQRIIKRESTWQKDYSLSSYQISYLKLFTDSTNGAIPIPKDASDPDDPFNVLCFAVAAPTSVVSRFFANWQSSITSVIQRKKQAADNGEQLKRRDVVKAQKAARELLAQKAKEAKEKVLHDWRLLVLEVNPAISDDTQTPSLIRWKKVFVSSAGNVDRERLKSAISSTFSPHPNPGSKRPPILSRPKPIPSRPVKVDRSSRSRSSVQDLIQAQHAVDKTSKKAGKKSGTGKEGDFNFFAKFHLSDIITGARRARFAWNLEYDELAQDATAVVAARCRTLGRMDWGAMDQVFPGTDRNGVRQRMLRFRDEPGFEAYMLRLEAAFYKLWVEHRGTDELPDNNPESPANFNLVAHIMFLRKFIDKAALRSGNVHDTTTVKIPELPARMSDLESLFSIISRPIEPQWDFMWNVSGEEQRERAMVKEPLVSRSDVPYDDDGKDATTERVKVAEAAIKMMLETSDGNYDPEIASSVLKSCGEDNVSKAMEALQSANVITRVTSDTTKRAPGRAWRFQDWQQESIVGPINSKMYRDAQSFEETLIIDSTQDWSLLADDGDMASLIQLVSDDKVEIMVDTSGPAIARPELEGNSKKVADDQLETSIIIQLQETSQANLNVGPMTRLSSIYSARLKDEHFLKKLRSVSEKLQIPHGSSVEGVKTTSCALAQEGKIVDCVGCIDASEKLALADLGDDDLRHALEVIKATKGTGITFKVLMSITPGFSEQKMLRILSCMTSSPVPPIFWTGYAHPVIVSSLYLRHWTVRVPGDSPDVENVLFPRRWLDIYGDVIERVWSNALRQVAGWIWNRPGISLFDLRGRIKHLFDKHEVIDVIERLSAEGMLEIRYCLPDCSYPEAQGNKQIMRPLTSFDNTESQNIFLMMTGEYWYRIPA
ncbi:hypothetical protein FRC03_010296 [Tulasnella sp. 419]|nr:hypothetical protein FRC03_010296 [Tulasnella sp. 419]